MDRNLSLNNTSALLLIVAALNVCACAPEGGVPKPLSSNAPEVIQDDKGPIDPLQTDRLNAQEKASTLCPNGREARGPLLPLIRLTETELNELKKQAPLDTDEYPLTTPGIGNNKAGLKHTPFSVNKQIAYKVDLSRYSPPANGEPFVGLKLSISTLRKYSKRKREFVCVLESHQCSGEMTNKVKRHLNPDWQKEYKDHSFSQSYFNQIGTWRGVSLSRGNLVYEKKTFTSYLNETNDTHFVNTEALASGKLTLIFGTQTYFEPENAKLQILISYCRE